MFEQFAPGTYFPIDSPLHRLRARTKLLVLVWLVGYTTAANQLGRVAPYGALVLLALLGAALARVGARALWRRMRWLTLLTLLGTIPAILLLGVEGTTWFALGPLVVTYESVRVAAQLAVSFLALYLLALLLTMTTSPVALIEGVTLLLGPLRRLRLPVDAFALMALLALRFIPTLANELELLVKAQTLGATHAVKAGPDAVRQVQQLTGRRGADVVVLDMGLPDRDGLDALREIRRWSQVPVLVLSGRALSLEDVQQLDFARVTFQSKDILSGGETAAALHAALSGATALARPTSQLVKRTIAYIQQHHMHSVSRQEIASALGVSKNYLTQIFHHELGISPWEYLNRYRIQHAKTLLRGTDASITAIASEVGFEDASYFGRVFRKQVGCSPQSYREQS